MDFVSAGCSLTVLVDVAENLLELRRQFKLAPEELQFADLRVDLLANNLELLRQIEKKLAQPDNPSQAHELLRRPVANAIQSITLIQKRLPKGRKGISKRDRLRWVFSHRTTFGEVMNDWTQTEIALHTVLQLAQILPHLTSLPPNSNNGEDWGYGGSLGGDESDTAVTASEIRQPDGDVSATHQQHVQTSVAGDNDHALTTAAQHCQYVHCRQQSAASAFRWYSYNIGRTTASVSTLCNQSTSFYSLQLNLLAHLSLKMSLMLRTESWYKSLRVSIPGSITITPLVAADSAFLTACREGNVPKMKAMLERKEASPIEMTDEGVTALCLAIQNGDPEAVRLLLHTGASVDEVFGQKNTSALCWAIRLRKADISRMLIACGASFHHYTAHGWSALFYLWPTMEERNPMSAVFINMLRENEINFRLLHEGLIDTRGWGLIHRASVFGTPEDVELLLQAGVDPFEQIGGLGWTALHIVVEYGVHDTFLVLFSTYQSKYHINPAQDLRDSRGYTLLHIALASSEFKQGHIQIIRSLLQAGADPEALTESIEVDVPDSIRGISCSCLILAHAYGENRYFELQEAISNNFHLGQTDASHDAIDDIWYDAI